MGLFQRPANINYKELEAYVNCWDRQDEQKLFEALYFLCDRYARNRGYFNSSGQYEQFSIQAASQLFGSIDQCDGIFNYKDSLDDIAYDIRVSIKNDAQELALSQENFEFKNHYLDLLQYKHGTAHLDLRHTSSIIDSLMHRVPKDRQGAEHKNIKLSVLCTVLNVAEKQSPSKIFDIGTTLPIDPICYHLDDSYKPLILCLSSLFFTRLRNLFDNVLCSKWETLQTLKLKEIINE